MTMTNKGYWVLCSECLRPAPPHHESCYTGRRNFDIPPCENKGLVAIDVSSPCTPTITQG